MIIFEVELLKDNYQPDFIGCGAYEWCVENNAFHLYANAGEHLFINFDYEMRFENSKRIRQYYIDKLMGVIKGDKISTRFLCFHSLQECIEYTGYVKFGNIEISDLRFIRKIEV